MHWIDWLITLLPLTFILGFAFYSRYYVHGVADYLAAGRVAGRYVISVAGMETSLGVITLVALVEIRYQTGYAFGFWENLAAPVGIIMALTGFCVYRFRETRALSIGQFLEMRYNRPFRIFAAVLRTTAEMLTNAIGPAIAANFFIYFMGLPHRLDFCGITIPTFAIVVVVVLILAVAVIWPAGRISLLITDCFQGLLCYPIFVLIAGFVLLNFSWENEIAPVMMDRVSGESFFNPFDIEKLRDFNIFAIIVAVTGSILNRASWIGNDTSGCGRTAHEQKMAGILGAWRNGFSSVMGMLVAVMIITVLTHENFAPQARGIRRELSCRITDEIVQDQKTKLAILRELDAIPEQKHRIGIDRKLSNTDNLDTVYLKTFSGAAGSDAESNYNFQKFRTLYYQMMMPVTLRRIFPVGLIGVVALMMIMLMLSTDDSRIFNSSATLVQDVIVPMLKKPMSSQMHIVCLRISTVLVAVFFFMCSLLFAQLDYINMFIIIMTAVWLGGAGPVMVFGLYSRFGTSAGAFSAIFAGSGFSIAGVFLQRNWAKTVYPFLERTGTVETVGNFLTAVSKPFDPWIVWKMDPVKCPVNSYEFYFLAMIFGVVAYVAVSLLTCRKPYDLDRLLHRGKYKPDGEKDVSETSWSMKNFFSKLVGITPEYTTGDRIIAWSVFGYSIVFQVFICCIGVLIWNLISPWENSWWSCYFYYTAIIIAGIVAVVSTVWFLWGGIRDMRQLFRDLDKRRDNPLDNGMVEGNVSVADKFDAENKA